jgi:hypothetical protein
MSLVVLISVSDISSFPLSSFFVIPSITPYSISISSLTPRHSTNRFSFISYRKLFEAFDGETIAAMDPESFAEYLGSQSLVDMMASAGASAGADADAGAGVEGVGDRDGDREGAEEGCRDTDMGRGWNKDTVTTHTSNFVST